MTSLGQRDAANIPEEHRRLEREICDLGVGGYCLFGGEASSTRDLIRDLAGLAPHRLLVASDLERGLGQQLRGGTVFPCSMAVGATARTDFAFATGFATGREARDVGIDIEVMARDVDIEGVARQAFSPVECEALTALSPEARPAAFFRVWTRKEAYVKARGDGLGYPTRTFSVSHLAGGDDALLADECEPGVQSGWRVLEIAAPDGFCAALAAPGRDWSAGRFDARTLLKPDVR